MKQFLSFGVALSTLLLLTGYQHFAAQEKAATAHELAQQSNAIYKAIQTAAPNANQIEPPPESANQAPAVGSVDATSTIAQLEKEIEAKSLQQGADHPDVISKSKMLDKLRQVEQEKSKQPVTVFKLKYASPSQAVEKIKMMFPFDSYSIVADERTSSLMCRGEQEMTEQIEHLIHFLDAEVANKGIPPFDKKPSTSREKAASGITEYGRHLTDLEKPVLELAEKLRTNVATSGKDDANSVKLRAELQALVKQTFIARQEIQRAELVEFSRRLKDMQQAIEARDRIADKIVDRRMEELLDPNLNWTPSESSNESVPTVSLPQRLSEKSTDTNSNEEVVLVGGVSRWVPKGTKTDTLTMENYEKITVGMTPSEVESILGKGSQEGDRGNSAREIVWYNGNALIRVAFTDGKVTHSAQSGLQPVFVGR
jgi:hypothetical protein